MSTQTLMIEPLCSEELVKTDYSPNKPSDHRAQMPISTMLTLLSAQYQPTLEAVLKKYQLHSTLEGNKTANSIGFAADDIKLIAAEALRISNEQSLSSTNAFTVDCKFTVVATKLQ
jgi:hypothetical protein